ncbi:MAG: MATE family efflux transporter, partial [Cyanobacteria bacterium J06642_11]
SIWSVGLGVGAAISLLLFPKPVFGLLTDHQLILNQVTRYVPWLLPLFGFGAIAFMLDGYFLGLTASSLLRNSTVIATTLGFVPLALVAHAAQNPNLLWLAMTCFMVLRAFTLLRAVPASLAKTNVP